MIEVMVSVAILLVSVVTIALGVPASNRFIDRKVRYDLTVIDPAKPIIIPQENSSRTGDVELKRVSKMV